MATNFIQTSEMNTLTHRNLRRVIIDQRYKSQTLLAILKAKKRLVVEDGGNIIAQPVLANLNETAQSYSGADVWNVDPNEEFTNYQLEFKQFKVSVTITGKDKRANAGRSQSINFVTAKQDSAILALMNLLSAQLFGDGSGNDSKDLDGMAAAINTATGFQNYLGIDRIANPWWQAQAFTPATATALSAGNMNTLFAACRTDIEVPDVMVTTKATYALYESLITPGERLVDDFVGNLGFDNIAFKGKPMVEDSHSPAGQILFLNLDHVRLVAHKDCYFLFRDFQTPVDQDVEIGHWLLEANVEVRKPSSCGLFSNILNG